MPDSVLTIGISGGTCSGKTTLTESIYSEFKEKISVLYHDNYYKDHNEMNFEEKQNLNYDHPEAIETDLFISHLKELKNGRPIACPQYDYTTHSRKKETVIIYPKPIIIVEGILILTDPELRDMIDIKIFVDTDADERLSRRILRDAVERKRDIESVISQYIKTVKPMHLQYVEPSKRYADIILNGGKNIIALQFIAERIKSHINSF